jgi:hypothetical protein
MKKLIIAGGTGFLGQALIAQFEQEYDEIVVLSRSGNRQTNKIRYVQWDAKSFGAWNMELEGAEAIINLSGRNINCRYNKKNKAEILASRLESTTIIGEAILKCTNPPKAWINASATGIYQFQENKFSTEVNAEIGTGFIAEVCVAWEKAVNNFKLPQTRQLIIRTSMVLGHGGGAFPVMSKLATLGLGGTLGKGTQQVSWIHIADYCALIKWMIDTNTAVGVYNGVSPTPIMNKDMMRLFRQKAHIKIGLPAYTWMLEIGAFFIGTETEIILGSTYAYPERALNEGFTFKYKTMQACLDNL